MRILKSAEQKVGHKLMFAGENSQTIYLDVTCTGELHDEKGVTVRAQQCPRLANQIQVPNTDN